MPSNKDPSLLQVSYGRLNVEQLPLLFREHSDRILNAVDNEVGVLAEGKSISLMSTQVEHVLNAPAAGTSSPIATATEIRDVAVTIPNSDVATISPLIYRDAIATAAGSTTSQASAGNVPKDITVIASGNTTSLTGTGNLIGTAGSSSTSSTLSPLSPEVDPIGDIRGLWRGSFQGPPWKPDFRFYSAADLIQAGAGTAGIGTAVNGHTPVVFTNTNQSLTYTDWMVPSQLWPRNLGQHIPSSTFYHTINARGWLLVKFPTAPNADICYLTNSAYNFKINIGTSLVTFSVHYTPCYPGAGSSAGAVDIYDYTHQASHPGTNQWMVIQWCSGNFGDQYLRVNRGTIQAFAVDPNIGPYGAPTTAATNQVNPLILGNTNSGLQILELGTSPHSQITDPLTDELLARINTRYGLSL